jgi:hypothetical protein
MFFGGARLTREEIVGYFSFLSGSVAARPRQEIRGLIQQSDRKTLIDPASRFC